MAACSLQLNITAINKAGEALRQLAAVIRQTADAFERMVCMLPGAWPDYFTLLNRYIRTGYVEPRGGLYLIRRGGRKI